MLVKYDGSEDADKIRYLFFKNVSSSNWQQKYRAKCLLTGTKYIPQGDLDEYAYFLLTHPLKVDKGYNVYYLLIDNEPVTTLTTHLEESGYIDVSFTTAPKFCGKGYATEAVSLIEQEIWQDEFIKGIKMVDMSLNQETSKIALKLGYLLDNDMNWYYKDNPYYLKNMKR